MQITFKQPAQLWEQITRPHTRVTNTEQRRQSALLNAMVLILVLVLIPIILQSTYRDIVRGYPLLEFAFLTPYVLVLLTAFGINRAGYYQTSAYLFIITGVLMLALFSLMDFSILYYFTLILPVSAMFLRSRDVGYLTAAVACFALGYFTLRPDSGQQINIYSLANYLVAAAAIILIYMWHRQQIEIVRRADLEAANQKLRESEALLEQRVKERTAELADAQAETQVALEKAVNADRLKSQFLASMSHELRTPLNSILTFNELMQMGTFGPVNDEQVDYLGKSLQSGRHLLSLINDVLDITKIQSGMMKLFVEDDFDVRTEVQTVAETAKRLVGDKPISIVVDVDPNIPPVTCDKRRVRQVMLNLMANAVKFTEQGAITLSIKQQPGHLLFAIMDTGPGIAPEQHDVIFEPFIQTVDGIKHAGGTGLGLPISKRIVESHGGQLWVESTPGDGSDFYFTLPTQVTLETGEQEMTTHA